MIDKKHEMKRGEITVMYHHLGSWAGPAALTRQMKALIEQEDEEREGKVGKTPGSLASPQTDPTLNNLETRKLDQVS